jgi:hypothetical protein
MKPDRVVLLVALPAIVALGPAGCWSPARETSSAPSQTFVAPASSTTGISLSSEEEKRLDKLNAAGVAKAYFLSGDSAVEYYLSGSWLREVTSQPNFVPEHEREGGIDDLVVEGPFSGVPSQVYNVDEWPEQVHFRATYTSRKTDSIGQPPGKRLWFVTVGRQATDSPWKILEMGSGP